jgi:type II secretion system protein D
MGQRLSARSGAVPFWKSFKLRKWLPGVLAAAAGLVGPVDRTLAQPVPVMPAPGAPGTVTPMTPAAPVVKKTVSINFDKMKWEEVLDWYSKETGLTLITTVKPTGTLTLKPNKDRKFTMAEVTDLLNEALTQDKFILIRRHMTFFIHPADEKIDPTMLPRLELNELADRGKTEIVQVILPIEGMVVADVQDELKKLLTPFGSMVPLETPNMLLLQDTVGNIERIRHTLSVVTGEKGHSDSLDYVCKWRPAPQIAKLLETLLADKTTNVAVTGAAGAAPAVPEMNFGRGFGGGGGFGPGGFGPGGFGPGGGGPGGGRGNNQQQAPTTNARVKTVQIAVDTSRNAILVTAPQDKIVLAKQIIEKQDTKLTPDAKEYKPAPAIVQTYTVPTGSAAELAKNIQSSTPWLQVVALPQQNQILVIASPDDQASVRKLIGQEGGVVGAVAVTVVIPLSVLSPDKAATALAGVVPTPAQGGPVIQAQTDPNPGLLVKGTESQINDIKTTLAALGEPIGTGAGTTISPNARTITVDGGNAAVLAELMQRAMQQMGKNATLVDPLNPQQPRNLAPGGGAPAGGGTIPPLTRPPVQPVPPPPMQAPLRGPGLSDLRQPVPGRDYGYAVPVSAQLVDPEKKSDKPIVITVIGNKIIIQSEDTAALDVLAALTKFYTAKSTTADDNLFKVIPLKLISAEDAAREITEIFNGPQQQQQGRGGGLGGGLNPLALLGLGGGGAAPAAPAPGRVRVVAEKSSNSLIVVKASPLDLLLIEKLLYGTIDAGNNESATVLKTFIIPVKNAKASDLAYTIKDHYKSAMATTGGNTQVAPLPFMPFAQAQPQGQAAQRPPQLAVTVDDRSNQIILLCPEPLYEDIATLVKALDNATVSTTEVTRVVKLKGVDPDVVQQAIAALQGRDTRFQQNGRGGFGGGGFGGGPGGGGGFGGGPGGGGGFGGGPGGGGGFGGGPGGGFGGGPGGGGFAGGGPGGGFGGGGMGGMGGGGMGGMGGGGMGGGGMGGGGMGGGGGARGGGGGGGGGRRGGGGLNRAPGSMEGPANFNYRGKEAPSVSFKLYDPETDEPDFGYNRPAANKPQNQLMQVGAYQPDLPRIPMVPGGGDVPGGPIFPPMDPPNPPYQPGAGAPAQPARSGTAITGAAPRGFPTAIPVTGLGAVIVRAQDVGDLDIVLQLIDLLQEQAKGTQPRFEVVYLNYGDCNYIANTLNTIFARVTIGQNGDYIPVARTAQAGAFNAVGGGGGVATAQNVVCLALPQFNAILISAPEARFDDVVREMRRLLDQPNQKGMIREFKLERQSAQIIATQLQNFWNVRFPGDTNAQNQFRVTFDVANNKIFVQASPADLKDVEELLAKMDSADNKAVNDMRVFYLRNALSDELGQVLSYALTGNVLSPQVQTQQTGPAVASAAGAQTFGGTGAQTGLGAGNLGGTGLGGGNLGGFGGGGTGLGTSNVRAITALIPTIGAGVNGGLSTKSSNIRFYSAKDGKAYETGYLEDVHIVSSARVNALIVSAPTATMSLIEKLIDNLDTVAAARSYVNVFQLRKGMDATLTANLIAQLFTGQGRQTTTGIGGGNTGVGGTSTTARPLIVLGGNPADGASLIDLRISVDDRTNSMLVAGSLNDLQAITAIVARLEGADVQARYNEVVKLRNAAAADVANAVQTYFTNVLAVYTSTTFNTAFQILQRQVVVIAEPVSNTVLISATPEFFGEIKRMIDKIDSQPPQVMIQVMIAEVQLSNDEELGVEFGLQSPVLFNRAGAGAASGLGYNFNTPAPSSTLPTGLVSPTTVGFQGVNNLGVGRTSTTQGIGGFVFSASSGTFSLLLRALKTQGRVEILSRPQLQVADNQTGYMNIGQSYPILGGSTIATGGLAQQSVTYVDIGVSLQITPRVNPDGKVLLRVAPTVSSVSPTAVSLGNGVTASSFNNETIQTTVLASDGETIVIGGLITKQDTRQENGVPYMKDLPYVGALFRYRTHQLSRRELLFIMTPHIVRSEFDSARVLAEEAGKLKLCWPDILDIHKHGGEVIGPATQGARPVPVNPAPLGQYFGPYDPTQPNGMGAYQLQPGTPMPTILPAMPPGVSGLPVQPGQQPVLQPGAVVHPGMPQPGQPGGPLPGALQQVPGQPSTLPPVQGQSAAPVQPGAGPTAAGPQGAATPQLWPGAPSGLMPMGGTQPAFTPPTFAPAVPASAVQPASAQPGFAPPAASYPQPTSTPPAAPQPVSAQPAPQPTFAPPAASYPQPTFAPPAAPQPAFNPAAGPLTYPQPAPQPGYGPVASGPTYGPPAAAPGFVMMPQQGAVPPAPPAPPMPASTGYPVGYPMMVAPAGYPAAYPTAVQPLPGTASRGFVMTGGQPPQQPAQPAAPQQPQPVSGKDAPPADKKPATNTATEGNPPWANGNFFPR